MFRYGVVPDTARYESSVTVRDAHARRNAPVPPPRSKARINRARTRFRATLLPSVPFFSLSLSLSRHW